MPEKKTIEEIEREAEEKERTIVQFENVDIEDFTHSFRGVTITIRKGAREPMRLPEAMHMAKHLAKKILSREAKQRTPDRMKETTKYTPEQLLEKMNSILRVVGVQETGPALTPAQQRERDQQELKKEFSQETPPAPEVSKADIIKDLKSRGLKVDVTKTKEELLNELIAAESQGIRPKE